MTQEEIAQLDKDFLTMFMTQAGGKTEVAKAMSMYSGTKFTLTDKNGKTYENMSYNSAKDIWTNGSVSFKGADIKNVDFENNILTAKTSAEDYNKPAKQPTSGGNTGGGNTGGGGGGSGFFAVVGSYDKPIAQMPADQVRALQKGLNEAGFTDNNGNQLVVDGIYGSKTKAAVKKLQQAVGAKVDGSFGAETKSKVMNSQWRAYATGGLADYTGPAWLDGTPSKPEMVLNPRDTENFIQLKNVLADLLKNSSNISQTTGDTYFDIHIDVDELSSDYDVEQVIDKITRYIQESARYRNSNVINVLH